MNKVLLALGLVLVLVGSTFAQGTTTSSIRGRVTDSGSSGLPGATVLAVHTPTGAQWGNITDANGYFRMPNVNVGGPYTITITSVGFEQFQRTGIYLTLGQTFNVNAELGETTVQLDPVVVVANDVFDGNRTGQQTIVGEEIINSTPTVSRSIADYARLNPFASIGEGGDGFSISIAGQNNRYNAIYIDGAVNNDVFGLAGSGTNGGQTGTQPISIDAIEQFQIDVAPFDVRQSGFAGGSINAVTRSGTNEIEGSAYYFWRNENIAGKTPTAIEDNEDDRERLAEFTAETYGFRVGGPIIKDKLFFFVNGELQRDETPQPFNFDNYNGSATRAQLNELSNFLINEYNYNPGGFENNTASLESDRFLYKLDWNASDNHKISFRHSFNRAENLEARNSSGNFLGFLNGSEFFISTTNSYALEVKSLFGNDKANKFTVGYTRVRDDRDPFGDPFPTLRIDDGDGAIEIGSERFSTANLLDQDILTINNNFEYFAGKHSFLAGVNFEYYNVGNLFIRENYGSYRFFDGAQTGLESFLDPANQDVNGNPISSRIERSYSQVDNVAGDESAAIAAFSQYLLGVYLQDEIQVNNELKVTAGVRVDLPIFPDDVPGNDDFVNNTVPLLEAEGYDLKGASPGSFIETQVMFSPRVGFNWDISGEKNTQIRGGVGLFTSRLPLVWQGGAFNNYGFNIGGGRNDGEPFNPDVQSQWPGDVDLNNPSPSGQIDLFASDFKLPQVLKANIAIDQKLPFGLIGSLDILYNKYRNYIRYENLNLSRTTVNMTGGNGNDTRPLFDEDNEVDPTYTGVFLASNVDPSDDGYGINVAATITKPFSNGFQGSVSYSWGDAYSINDGTSSQNNSQWRSSFNVEGNNFVDDEPQRSRFAAGHRVIAQVSYRKEYLKNFASQISLFYNGQSGNPYTYVVGANGNEFVNDGGFNNNEVYYVPRNQAEANLVDDPNTGLSAADQWAILDQFISDDKYLSERRGQYTERNARFLPFQSIIDFRFLQDIYIDLANGKRNTLQFSVDIFNFTNFLNKDWGVRRFLRNGTYDIVQFADFEADGTTPQYTLNEEIQDREDIYEDDIVDSGFNSSRWQIQLGLRYIFGN